MKILMLGDVNGGPGRRMLKEHVKRLKAELGLAAVVANAENAAAGNGLTAARPSSVLRRFTCAFSMRRPGPPFTSPSIRIFICHLPAHA